MAFERQDFWDFLGAVIWNMKCKIFDLFYVKTGDTIVLIISLST
jgi:hypothetical protein